MRTCPNARRIATWTALPLGVCLAVGTKAFNGAPGWVNAFAALAGALLGVLSALLPQESEHRRDVWRDLLRHREHMARLALAAARRADSLQLPHDQHTPSADQARRPDG